MPRAWRRDFPGHSGTTSLPCSGSCLPPSTYLRVRVAATVCGEQLAFAHRIYNPEPAAEMIEALSPTQ